MTDIRIKELEMYLDTFENKPFKSFILKVLPQYGTQEKFEEAIKLITVIRAYYTKKKILADNVNPYFIELMETAALIHNLFFDGTWISCFIAREKLYDDAIAAGIQREHIEHIVTIVEGQLGMDMPIAGVRPNPNSPVEDFALCCWITKELLKNE